ncbi:MAG TPA: hypothetical protein P5059_00515 [Candidatus Dojkabacteria bacterium]|nr:hypothetical protein [Candidatus Dojkabacteria bacterium]
MNDFLGLENTELSTEDISLPVQVENSGVSNLIDKADIYVGNRKIDTTYENTREYWKSRWQENLNLLNREDPYLANVYANIVAEQPELQMVKLTNTNIQCNAYFSKCSLRDGQYIPEIVFNLSNQETYIDSSLEFTLRQKAIQLGAKYEDLKNNKRLVTTLVFLHEFGHAKDFFDNYLKPRENIGKRPIAEVLNNAITGNNERRLKDLMTLPAPSHIDFSKEEDRQKYTKRLETFGIKTDQYGQISKKQFKIVNSVAYREMSSESFADSFAVDYIKRHRNEYFFPLGQQDDRSGRIKTGGEIMMEDEDIILSGIRDGKSITIKKIAQEGGSAIPIGYSETGFLDGQLALGGGMRLIQDIDDSRFVQTSPLKWMTRRMLPDGTTLFLAKTVSGATYQVLRNPEVKPKAISKTIEEMNQALGIKAGSEVILMKRNLKKGAESAVVIGQTMMGRLKTSPELNKVIELFDENGNFAGSTSPVIEVRRIWRSWRFRTFSESHYEIIPT